MFFCNYTRNAEPTISVQIYAEELEQQQQWEGTEKCEKSWASEQTVTKKQQQINKKPMNYTREAIKIEILHKKFLLCTFCERK